MFFEADLNSVGLKNGIRSFYDINIDLEEQQKPHQKHIAPKDRSSHTFGTSERNCQSEKRFLLPLSNYSHLCIKTSTQIHLL
jgi:hypothetical protein